MFGLFLVKGHHFPVGIFFPAGFRFPFIRFFSETAKREKNCQLLANCDREESCPQ